MSADGWEDVTPKSNDGWEEVKPSSSFQSGTAFKDTKDLIPSIDDIKGAWETFKKQWEDRHNTPMTPEVMHKMMASEKAAGSAVLDTVGGLPGMVAGAVHGVGTGVANMDASLGLKTGMDTMTALLPSTLMGNKADQDNPAYHTAMAPVTAIMDTLNAIPTGYGEVANALGYDKAAQQITDAGKLGIMAGGAALGAREVMRGGRGKEGKVEDHASKLVDEGWEDVTAKAEEIKPETPVGFEDVPHQAEMFPTNPYDVAGHVTELKEGRPVTVDSPQGDLFGSSIQEALRQPELPVDSLLKTPDNAIPYTPDPRLSLEPMTDKPLTQREMGINMPEADMPWSLEAKESSLPIMNQKRLYDRVVEENRASAEAPAAPASRSLHEAYARAERDRAFKAVEEVATAQKDAHYQQLEHLEIARRNGELDYQHLVEQGDKTLLPRESTEAMQSALRGDKLSDALGEISRTHADKEYRTLADYLSKQVEGVRTVLHEDGYMTHGDRQVSGYYDPTTNTVGFSGVGASSPHTVMHETVHALTSRIINERPNDVRVMALKNLYNQMTAKGIAKDFPGVVNVKEFVSEAFSNPAFQERLKATRMDNRSMFTKFVDAVKTMFGMKSGIRTPLTNALEHAIDLGKQVMEAQKTTAPELAAAGLSKNMIDLMASNKPEPKVTTRANEGMEKMVNKIPGLEGPISDFIKYDQPVEAIVKMAQEAPDINSNMVDKLANQLQGGGLFQSLKTRNPVVKYTHERMDRAFKEAAFRIRENLSDPQTGLKAYMRELTPDQKGEIFQLQMLNEGQRTFSSQELAARGFNEKQIAYYNKDRELRSQFFGELNARREEMGLRPMDERVGHIAGRFLGDFYREVYADGKIVGRISGSTKWELDRVTKFMKDKHPDWEMGEGKYNKIGQGRSAADRFGGLMEAINFLSKADADVKTLLDSYREYVQADAVNFLNATKHAKAKKEQAGGIAGSQGNKEWLDAKKNAEEGMKAQLAYFEQGYEWMSVEKAVGDLKTLLTDDGVLKQQKNAVEWANQYVDHSMGRGQGKFADALNSALSGIGEWSTLGHSNILKFNNAAKSLMMQKFMGFANIPFTVTQLLQPLQVHPPMVRLLKNRGLEFSAGEAQMKAVDSYLRHEMSPDKMTNFEKAAFQYAAEMGVFDPKMFDHTRDINVSKFRERADKLINANIQIPETFTRGNAFLFYSHLLKDAGIPAKDIFGAAENLTNMTMVNYTPLERPMGYAKLGWIGDVASTLVRYKHNQLSQLAFYAREGARGGGVSPLATFLGGSLAFGGMMGFFGYQEANALYSMFSENVLKKPDNLDSRILNSGAPELLTHGIFSTLGLDMTTRFSNANILPDNIGAAVMPYGSAMLDMAQATGRVMKDPTSPTKQKQFVKAMAPQSMQGLLENQLFTEKQPDGTNLYQNSTEGPNLGKGRVARSDKDMGLRSLGFRNVRESKELAGNYARTQIEKGNANVVDGLLTKAKYAAMDNTLSDAQLQTLINRAAALGEDPSAFVGKLASWGMDRKLTQKQQILLRNAQRGYSGAYNIQQGQR